MLRQAFNPYIYHGRHRRRNFFEGWHFKLQQRNDNRILFQQHSKCAGIEYGGDQMLILD